jgi:hypothetical protein
MNIIFIFKSIILIFFKFYVKYKFEFMDKTIFPWNYGRSHS